MRLLRHFLGLAIIWTCSVTAASAAATPSNTILVFGDSLSAAYGIDVNAGWVALLGKRLEQQGYEYRVINASVSGETTSGGRNRFPQLLGSSQPEIVILELGANDGLRGLPLKQMRSNLEAMIRAAQAQNAKVLLLGMQIPPNYGEPYANGFQSVYTDLAREFKLVLVPFFLDSVALNSAWMQADNLHPNALGQPQLLENVWSKLKPVLKRRKAS